jgi:hypothetical protein
MHQRPWLTAGRTGRYCMLEHPLFHGNV